MCQCPKRATLISTVPSENPCKHWLSSLIFAGICQNILITSVFPPFFGLFTICSYLSLPSLLSIKKNYTSLPTKIKAFFHTNVMLSRNYSNVHTYFISHITNFLKSYLQNCYSRHPPLPAPGAGTGMSFPDPSMSAGVSLYSIRSIRCYPRRTSPLPLTHRAHPYLIRVLTILERRTDRPQTLSRSPY